MISAIASVRKNIESSRVGDVLPSYLREDSNEFIQFIEEYYRFLNSEGLPSREIAYISDVRDIDGMSLKYIDAIGAEIAKNVPNAPKISRVDLYKKIINYYNTRGTEDSVILFFKIFFDEMIEVYYPKYDILKPSDGEWVSQETGNVDDGFWKSTRGHLSSDKYLQDSEYYQAFSYVIKTGLPLQTWENTFAKFAHPAGLKFFAQIALYIIVKTGWKSYLDPRLLNYHSPTIQPGWLAGADRLLRFIFQASSIEEDQIRTVLMALRIISTGNRSHPQMIHESYDWNKFFDTTPADAYLGICPFNPDGSSRGFILGGLNFSNVGAIIDFSEYIPPVAPTYRRPDGVSTYRRPDGVSIYIRPT